MFLQSQFTEFFSGLTFTTTKVVLITVTIASIFVSSISVYINEFHIFTVIYLE